MTERYYLLLKHNNFLNVKSNLEKHIKIYFIITENHFTGNIYNVPYSTNTRNIFRIYLDSHNWLWILQKYEKINNKLASDFSKSYNVMPEKGVKI